MAGEGSKTDKRVLFTRIVPLPPDPAGWSAFGHTVLTDGNLGILRATYDVRSHLDRTRKRDGSWHHFEVPKDTQASVQAFDGRPIGDPVSFPLRYYPHCYFDRLNDGSWLICDMVDREGPNARRILPDGSEVALSVGNDVRALQASPDGSFWVGFGDFGCLTGKPGSLEAGGAVRLSADGAVEHSFNDREPALGFIEDVLAMNVSDAGAFACTWPNCSLINLADRKPRFLRSRTELPTAFAVDGQHFLLAG